MNEKQLEDALHNWPLVEVPPGFSASILERLEPRQSFAQIPHVSKPKFRLTWMDFALGMFFSLLPVLGFVTLATLPQKFILYLKYQWLLLQFPAFEPVVLTFAGIIGMLLLLVFLFSLRYFLPRQMSLF